jgi:hypothetical protein
VGAQRIDRHEQVTGTHNPRTARGRQWLVVPVGQVRTARRPPAPATEPESS